ncbi:MAG TPA: oligopeptide transporter, OPT family [Acidobacteriota bacterium]|nr:oligopeptide transporter, OPT family [Acidobacteriota bacterium]
MDNDPASLSSPEPRAAASPLVAASVQLPELTIKGVILGILLAIVLGGANAYLGLFAGMTVSASIPAAVVSMAVLRAFRNSNILENNLVQTAASAGESLAAGVIFTIPALVLMGHWDSFDYWQVTAIAAVGGIVGVLFSIPLRRALVIEEQLRFPEGVATAEVLKTGGVARGTDLDTAGLVDDGVDDNTQRKSIRALGFGALGGAAMKFAEAGMGLWSGTLTVGGRALGTIWVLGINLSPALIGVGYIVGLNIATVVFAGGVIAWVLGIPIYVWQTGMPSGDAVDAAYGIWSSQIRYLGVGAMVVGGLWALIKLIGPVRRGITSGIAAYRAARSDPGARAIRTENDAPMNYVLIATALCALPMFAVYQIVLQHAGISALLAVVMLFAGFFFAAIAGYMAGLVGSSNNPISGVTIATLLFASFMLLWLLGPDNPVGPPAAVFVGAMVACAAAISGDTMQDLKAGHLVGATPWRQQVMELVGVVSAAFVMMPVLYLLQARYGIGPPTPTQPDSLTAPQATLMGSVATGVFEGGLPWTMIIIGGVIAALIIVLDKTLETREASFRTPVLAVAVGIYLPLELTSSIFIGGLVWWAAERAAAAKGGEQSLGGLLLASGMITGEALIGIGLALPIVLSSWSPVFGADMFRVASAPLGGWPGFVLLSTLAYAMYRVSSGRR